MPSSFCWPPVECSRGTNPIQPANSRPLWTAPQALANAMQRLHIQLVIGFDRHEAHGWPCDSFGDRLSIDIVALVRLHVGLHILRRYQPHFVSLFPQCSAKKMRTSAGLHANQPDVYIRREPQQLCTRELLAHYDLAAQVKPDQMKNFLPNLNADGIQYLATPP